MRSKNSILIIMIILFLGCEVPTRPEPKEYHMGDLKVIDSGYEFKLILPFDTYYKRKYIYVKFKETSVWLVEKVDPGENWDCYVDKHYDPFISTGGVPEEVRDNINVKRKSIIGFRAGVTYSFYGYDNGNIRIRRTINVKKLPLEYEGTEIKM